MEEVHVNVYIHAPVERVFDAVADHERFLRSGDGTHTKVVRPGLTEHNGLGALREVRVGKRIRYVEEITAFERPCSFDYQIVESTQPLRHQGSRLRFTPRGEGTEIDWTSRFDIPLPLVGKPLGSLARRMFIAAFTELLLAEKARLEASQPTRAT
ncbi:SRPBCC family protein [Sorangium atrum]|uniref:SRPBCC family protein n=1 Tax=Sorangium atrum TaxID=2995308 RepID=A0ABT5C4I6_9BACT|nr:SRPBCC family protein [Sorangium aterium]MDC0680092.1 SRPBCC family protein [Sorangium aterium]